MYWKFDKECELLRSSLAAYGIASFTPYANAWGGNFSSSSSVAAGAYFAKALFLIPSRN